MRQEVDPGRTGRAEAFALWMKAPMPMVTLFKTLDVTRAVRLSRRRGCKFNMLLCWCIASAASRHPEFLLLPENGKLIQFDRLAVSTIAAVKDGGICPCDILFSPDLRQFEADYLASTRRVRETGQPLDLSSEAMVIGASALPQTELDGAVNIYAGCYCNPFLIWGRYRRHVFQFLLPMSFQFHHTQMDGGQAAAFLETLQQEIRGLSL